MLVQVADFGLSAVLPQGGFDPSGEQLPSLARHRCNSLPPRCASHRQRTRACTLDRELMKAYNKLSDRWGTPHYFAPEMVRKAYGPQVAAAHLWVLRDRQERPVPGDPFLYGMLNGLYNCDVWLQRS